MALAMLPALVSAMAACTWHLFDNSEALRGLVVLQAGFTLVGNTALAVAALQDETSGGGLRWTLIWPQSIRRHCLRCRWFPICSFFAGLVSAGASQRQLCWGFN